LSQRIYLDDCAYDKELVRVLEQAGHQVVTPAQAGNTGQPDQVHFRYAAEHALRLLTRNPDDFAELHDVDANHAGILLINQDNDRDRDMTNAEAFLQALPSITEVQDLAAATSGAEGKNALLQRIQELVKRKVDPDCAFGGFPTVVVPLCPPDGGGEAARAGILRIRSYPWRLVVDCRALPCVRTHRSR
jgi:hypothetical protein